MSTKIFTSGTLARIDTILSEGEKRKGELGLLIKLDLPEQAKIDIITSYKKVKRKSITRTFLVLLVDFAAVVALLTFVGPKIHLDPTKTWPTLVQLLLGAIMVLPAAFAGMRAFKGSLWKEYSDWYKKASKLSHPEKELGSLRHILGIKEETVEESNERFVREMKARGATREQIEAAAEARLTYQEKKGLIEEREESINARLRKQMKENGYTDEQIEKMLTYEQR